MNKHAMEGFRQEMTKLSVSLEDGAKGLGAGAIVGALLSAIGVETLHRLVSRNKDLAIITGAIMGAGALGGAGFLLGKKAPVAKVTPAPTPPPSGIFHGSPPPGTAIGGIRHI